MAVVLLLLGAARAPAEEYRWSVDQAVQAALERNLTLKQSDLEVSRARQKLLDSWNLFLPSLGLGASASGPAPSGSPWSLGLSFDASLRLSPSVKAQVDRTRLDYEKVLVAHERAARDLTRQMKRSYYQALLLQSRIELARQNIELATRRYEYARRLYESGRAPELDVLSAQVAVESARPELLSLQDQLESLLAQIKDLAALEPEDTLRLEGVIKRPQLALEREEVLRQAGESSVSVRDLTLNLAIARADRVLSAWQARMPTLTLSYSYSPGFTAPLGASLGDPASWQGGTVALRLRVPVDPFIPHSAADSALRGYGLLIRKSELALREGRRSVRSDASELVASLRRTRATLEARVLAADLAEKSYQQTLRAYQQGGRQLLEVENANTQLQAARVGVLNETYNLILVLIDLEYLLGRSLF